MPSLFPVWKISIKSKLCLDEIYNAIDRMLICGKSKVIYYNFTFMWNDPKFIGKREDETFTADILSGKMLGTIRNDGEDNIVEIRIQSRCVACATLLVFTGVMDVMFAVYSYVTIHRLPTLLGILCTFIPSALCYLIVAANLEQTVRRTRHHMAKILS